MTDPKDRKFFVHSDRLCGKVLSVGKRFHRRVFCPTCFDAIFHNVGKPKHWVEM